MDIREITGTEAESYFNLRILSDEEFPEFVGFNAERELSVGSSGIAELLNKYPSEGTIVFGAFNERSLVGVTVLSRRLSPKYQHKGFLWGMYVLPEFRGAGIAQLLMQAAIDWARVHPDVIAISLQVTLSNIRGQKFYKRFGFSVFGTEQNSLYAAGQFHGVHYMELETANA
ncbi:MAG: GNAT family N-acetyltransferase [Agarilytica sp.]